MATCKHCGQEVARQGTFDERGPDRGPLVTVADPYDLIADVCIERAGDEPEHEVVPSA